MTIVRNPVEGVLLPHTLACVDIDPVTGARTGDVCQRLQDEHRRKVIEGKTKDEAPKKKRGSKYFVCPNRGNGVDGRCDTKTFLYPRRWEGSETKGRFHIHQGLDLMAPPGTPIRSVTSGTVLVANKEYKKGFSGYGRVVLVESNVLGAVHYFFYAHCEDVFVREKDWVGEGQQIATVGTTAFTASNRGSRMPPEQAHLHFEVSTKEYPLGDSDERVAGKPFHGKGRLDPRQVLENLGPWSMTKVHVPTSEVVDSEVVAFQHSKVDANPSGGYFPLGINNSWHGGLHLSAPQDSTLVAPFDATIVAARLDPDPATALHHGGHTNFILLRHEVSAAAYALFQGKTPDDVFDDPPSPGGDPSTLDPKRTLYCLLLHLQPLSITDALAKRFPWVAKLDPALRTPARAADGMAPVLAPLDIRVHSGEALWASGQARGFTGDTTTSLFDQVHWELFSEHLLPSEWDPPLEDSTDDLTLDVPRHVIDQLEHGGPTVDDDGQLEPHEVREIYRTGRAHFLRRTPCRFVNQWALDLDKAIARLDALGYATAGLREQLVPFMWWPAAAGVLPPSRFVWHYDPLELLADYAKHLAELSPDPVTHPTLEVRVLYDNRMPMIDVPVHVRRGEEILRLRRTDRHGVARFRGLPVGDYEVRTPRTSLPPEPVAVVGGRTTTVDFHTDLPGPPPPRGSIRVIVRNHRGTREPGVRVALVSTVDGFVGEQRTNANGEVRFEDVRHDDYTVSAGSAKPYPVTLDSKEEMAKPMLPAPLGLLRIAVTIDGAPAPRQRVKISQNGKPIADALSDDEYGLATFHLPEARYRARVGNTSRVVVVTGDRDTTRPLPLSSTQAPPAEILEEGRLEVWVHRRGEDVPDEWVFVLEPGGSTLDIKPTDRDGLASFELPVGEVLVGVADESATATVSPVAPTRVDIELLDG